MSPGQKQSRQSRVPRLRGVKSGERLVLTALGEVMAPLSFSAKFHGLCVEDSYKVFSLSEEIKWTTSEQWMLLEVKRG